MPTISFCFWYAVWSVSVYVIVAIEDNRAIRMCDEWHNLGILSIAFLTGQSNAKQKFIQYIQVHDGIKKQYGLHEIQFSTVCQRLYANTNIFEAMAKLMTFCTAKINRSSSLQCTLCLPIFIYSHSHFRPHRRQMCTEMMPPFPYAMHCNMVICHSPNHSPLKKLNYKLSISRCTNIRSTVYKSHKFNMILQKRRCPLHTGIVFMCIVHSNCALSFIIKFSRSPSSRIASL